MSVKIEGEIYELSVVGDFDGDGKATQIELTNIIRYIVGLKNSELEGIKYTSGGLTVDFKDNDASTKKEISTDGGKTYKEYTEPVEIESNTTIKARISYEEQTEQSELEIKNIDKLEPNEFTPTVTSDLISNTQLQINATTTDKEDETNENGEIKNGKSGISQYQYFVYNGETLVTNSDKTNQGTWTASNLTAGVTYNIKVVAYDNAGNYKMSNTLNYKKLNVYTWDKYYSVTSSEWTYSEVFTTDYLILDGSKYYPRGINIDNGFDKSTGYWTANDNTHFGTASSNVTTNSYIILNPQTYSSNAKGKKAKTIYYITSGTKESGGIDLIIVKYMRVAR